MAAGPAAHPLQLTPPLPGPCQQSNTPGQVPQVKPDGKFICDYENFLYHWLLTIIYCHLTAHEKCSINF